MSETLRIPVFVALCLLVLLCGCRFPGGSTVKEIHVAPEGSKTSPAPKFSSLEEALAEAVGFLSGGSKREARVILHKGTYYLREPLLLDDPALNNPRNHLLIKAAEGEEVLLSGGLPLKEGWVKAENRQNGQVWSYALSAEEARDARQLFLDGERVPRSSSKRFFTAGPWKEYAPLIKRFDFQGASRLKREDIKAFAGFTYQGRDLEGLSDQTNAEVLVHHSWESSWHEIVEINPGRKEVLLSNPFRYPVSFFSPELAYYIENSADFFTQAGTWMTDRSEDKLLYLAREGEDPNAMPFVLAKLPVLMEIKGERGQKVHNIHFEGIHFAHSSYRWGINDIETAIRREMEERYSWLDFGKGYSSAQAAPNAGEAILVEYGDHIGFDHCIFSNMGAYALRLGRGSANSGVRHCEFYDLGAGAILLGMSIRNVNPDRVPKEDSPHHNLLEENIIREGGKIHPSGVGIGIMQAHKNTVRNNIIHDMPYSGISMGWTWNDAFNYTKDNLIQGNHIFRVMQLLADGAGIYTLGDLAGCRIEGNFIHSIKRSDVAVGASVNGLFFDQASSGLEIRDNLVEGIDGLAYKFNRAEASSMIFFNNLFDGKTQ